MKWDKQAIEDLRLYSARRASLDNNRLRIAALKEQAESVKCAGGTDSTPVQGGGNKIEDRLLSNIVERQRLALTYAATKKLVDITQRGLESLESRERQVLDEMYVKGGKGGVERIMDVLHIEKSQVYRMKDSALYNFTVHQYGLQDY